MPAKYKYISPDNYAILLRPTKQDNWKRTIKTWNLWDAQVFVEFLNKNPLDVRKIYRGLTTKIKPSASPINLRKEKNVTLEQTDSTHYRLCLHVGSDTRKTHLAMRKYAAENYVNQLMRDHEFFMLVFNSDNASFTEKHAKTN